MYAMSVLFIQSRAHDPRLKRNVKHDTDSLKFPYRAPGGTSYKSIRHQRYVPVFDQGQLGDCTANAAEGCLGTGKYYATIQTLPTNKQPAFTQDGALGCVSFYSEETKEDDYQGTYPPDDTGSDGLTAAKVAEKYGWISGYTHNLSGVDGAALILQDSPFITGVNWY